MASIMKTRTEYTFDALVELQRVVCRNLAAKQTARRKLVSLVWGTCCLGMGVFMVSHGYNALLAMLLLIPGVVSMLRYVFFYHVLAWGASRNMSEEQSVNDFYFEEKNIIARQGKKSSVYPYNKCYQLLETKSSFFFIMDDGQGLMLDKSNLSGGTVDELRAMLEEKSGQTARSVK